MFASQTIQLLRNNNAVRRGGTLLIVGAMSLFLGACVHNTGNAPAMQWQFNSSDAGSAGPAMYAVDSEPLADVTVQDSAVEAPRAEASEHSAAAPACGHGGDGWSSNCYVYRGGRDPITGRASTQL